MSFEDIYDSFYNFSSLFISWLIELFEIIESYPILSVSLMIFILLPVFSTLFNFFLSLSFDIGKNNSSGSSSSSKNDLDKSQINNFFYNKNSYKKKK